MALPDVDTASWNRDQADLFRQLTNAKIGAAQFQQTTGQQIADASARLAALPTPSSLEGPSTRASQASQPLDTTSGSAPSAPTLPVQASFGDSSTQASDTASGSRGGSFGDFASGLIDQARQRVAALTNAPPGGPADVSQENVPPSWLPGRQAAGVTESPEDALRSRVATVPNVPEAAGQVGQALVDRMHQTATEQENAFEPMTPTQEQPYSDVRQQMKGYYTPEQQQRQFNLTANAVMSAGGGEGLGTVAGEAAAPVAEAVGATVAQDATRAGNILLSKFPKEVQPFLTDAASTLNDFATQTRGTISDPQALKNAAETALGTPIETWLKSAPGRAFNQEQAIALGQTLAKQGTEFDALARQAQDARLNGTITPALQAAVADKALQFGALASVRSGATAEAGRALRAFRTGLTGANASQEAAIGKAFGALGTEPAKFADWLNAWTLTPATDAVGRYKLLQQLGQGPTALDKVLAWTVGNMLSSTKTAEVIAGHGLIQTLNRPLLTLIRASPAEAMTDVAAMGKAVGGAWGNAAQAFLEGVGPTTAAAKMRGGVLEARPDAFPGKTGIIATPALRVIAGMHEFFRTLSTAGALAVSARQEAAATGRTVADLMANPTPKMLDFATKAADDAVSGGTPSPFAQLLLSGRALIHKPADTLAGRVANVGTGLAFHVLTPFVRIPDYLYRNGMKIAAGPVYYPVTAGVHLLRGEGGQALSDAKMWGVTSLLGAAIYSEAAAGNITGSGPSDPRKLALLQAARDPQGNPVWAPHSLRIGGRWYDYTTLGGPLTVPLALYASAVEAYRLEGLKPSPDYAKAVASDTLKTLMDASYIRTIGDIFKSLQQGNPTGALSTLAVNTAGRMVPLGGLAAEVGRTLDPNAKAPEDFGQGIAARIPGLSRTVPNQVGPYGGPVTNPQDALALASPAKTSAPGLYDPVTAEVARLVRAGQSVSVPTTPVGQQEHGGPYEGAQQTAAQMRELQTVQGANARRYLGDVIDRPGYAGLSDAAKAKALDTALQTSTKQATQGADIARDPPHQAALAWAQTPHYRGVDGTPSQIAEQNLQIEKARGILQDYTRQYGKQGKYRFAEEHPDLSDLARSRPLNAKFLNQEHQAIDQQFNGGLTQAQQQGLVDARAVLPLDEAAVGSSP